MLGRTRKGGARPLRAATRSMRARRCRQADPSAGVVCRVDGGGRPSHASRLNCGFARGQTLPHVNDFLSRESGFLQFASRFGPHVIALGRRASTFGQDERSSGARATCLGAQAKRFGHCVNPFGRRVSSLGVHVTCLGRHVNSAIRRVKPIGLQRLMRLPLVFPAGCAESR